MSLLRKSLVGLMLAASAAVGFAQGTKPLITAKPETRIVDKLDLTKVSPVVGSHPASVAKMVDQGRVPANTQFNKMTLVLKSSEAQEFALHGLMDAQQDKSSPNYHQWMTPETFGAAFGVASTDLAKVTAWLQDSGFKVDQVSKGGRAIQFTGTSGQVEKAFHTEMHQYMVKGEMRVANATDIAVPTALTPVVQTVASLSNFRLRSQMTPMTHAAMGTDGQFHPVVPGTLTQPDYTSATSGSHYVGGGDIPVLYNSKGLIAAGNNGAGQKIGILGQTDILLGDIQTYRSVFGLPPNSPNFIVVGNDPGTIPDDVESDLDVELSGAFAPGATIDFYLSGNSYFGGGIDASGLYVVDNNSDDIISLSYGECEANLGSYNAFFNILWEQAASQGISVFVSSGDSGPDVCDDGAASGSRYSVSGLSGTPYNVSVGGTMFNEGTTTGATSYWGPASGPPYVTALGYIPEYPWNEGKFDIYPGGYGGIVSGSSGISIEYGTPSWQAGPGVPTTDPTPSTGSVTGFVVPGPHRYQPDVSLIAAGGHDGTIICSEGSCPVDSNGNIMGIGVVGGTSVAAPSFAGTQALINQKNGGRQGLPNYYYYRAAALQSTTNCNSATLPSAAGAACSFHDVQAGNNFIPSSSTGTLANGGYIGWTANAGYDLAVGLGSPDIGNLATNWKSITFNATTTTFTLTPTTSAHGVALTTKIVVTPVSGTGTPTGDISIIASNVANGGVGFYTLSGGSNTINSTLTGLPAGTYNVYAHYAGDVTFGGSNSAPVQVTISSTTSSIKNTPYLLAASGVLTPATTFTYGANVYIDSTVCDPAGIAAGGCADGLPTGSITYTLSNGGAALPVLVSPLDTYNDAYFDSGLGLSAYDIKPNYPSITAPGLLAPGTYTVNTSYNGDTTFAASTGTPFTITVGPANQALTLTTSTATVMSGGPVLLNASVATVAAAVGGIPATGTVTFTDTTTSTVLGTATLKNGAVVFSTNAVTAAGANSITATYSGDSNYLTRTSAAVTVTVGGTASTTTLATTLAGVATTTAQVGQSVVLTATVPATATGTVYFYDGAVSLGTAAVSTTTHTAARTVTNFTAGVHPIMATYAGNTTVDSSSSAVTTLTIAQNTPTLQLTNQTTNATGVGVGLNARLTPTPVNVAPISPVPTNGIQFLDGTTVLGTVTPTYFSNFQTYVAAYTTLALTPGTHTLSASYLGDANFAGAKSNVQTISIGLTTLSLSLSSANVVGGAPLTITVTVTPLVANVTPAGGTVTFYDGGTTVIGTGKVVNGVATLVTGTPTLAPGVTHTISASYTGDANYYQSTTTVSQTVVLGTTTLGFAASATSVGGGAPLTLTATLSPVTATVLAGSVTFLDGTTVIGTATFNAAGVATLVTGTPTLAPGVTHTLSASYAGGVNYAQSASGSTTVVLGLTTLALTSSTPTPGTGIPFTLTATIAPVVATPAPTGTVTFFDGTTLIGTATGTFAAGKATASVTLTTLGAHSLSAVYSGDTNYYKSTSTSSLTVTDVTPSFTIAVNPSSLTLTRGTTGTLTLTVTTIGSYSGYGLVNITGLPAGGSYTVVTSPILLTGVNGPQNYTLYITTSAPSSASGMLWLPAVVLAAFLGLRRRKLSVRLQQVMALAIVFFGMMAMSGCGSSTSFPGTAVGMTTPTVTVTGTGAAAADPNLAPTATFNLTVQ